MQFYATERQINTTLRGINTALLFIICVLLFQTRPLPVDLTVIQDRITKLNAFSEQRTNNLSASHDHLKSEMESRMAILESRVKLLQGRVQ